MSLAGAARVELDDERAREAKRIEELVDNFILKSRLRPLADAIDKVRERCGWTGRSENAPFAEGDKTLYDRLGGNETRRNRNMIQPGRYRNGPAPTIYDI